MKYSKWLCLLAAAVCLCPLTATAQFNSIAQSARSGALGGAVCLDMDANSLAVGYRQDFLLPSMAVKSMALQWNTGNTGTALAMYEHNGNTDYNEQQVGLGYVMKVTSWLNVGVAGRYLYSGTSDGHYASQQWLAASALLMAQVTKSTSLVLLAGHRPWDDIRPMRFHLQAAYKPLPALLTLMELESEECLRWRFGMEYCYEGHYFVRAGMATHPTVLTFGLGMRQGRHYALDLAIEAHNTLGITPQITLTLCF